MIRLFSLISIFFITSCSITNISVVEPESLLNSSSENVSFGLANISSLNSIASWIQDDKPAEAELSCSVSDLLCTETQDLLIKNSVPFRMTKSPNGLDSITLLYERITAHDCNGRSLGCSVAANSLQMVSNHVHFVRPPLSDLQDANKAVDNYEDYLGK